MRRKSRLAKAIIAIAVIIFLLAAIAVTLVFTIMNNFKFMTYTSGKVNAAYESINMSDVRFIAHRGLSAEAYQNTEAAFLLAAEEPTVWGIETDVWATADGEFVCMHDGDALQGIDNVRDVSLEEALSAPLAKNTAERACSFDRYLEICRSGGKTAVIEIKDKEMTESDLDLLMEKVRESGVNAKYISFHFAKLKYIRACDESAEMQFLTVYGMPKDISGATVKKKMQQVIDLRCDLSIEYRFLSKTLADMFHGAGLKVGVWTVNGGKNAACLQYTYGVDYITTDMRKSELLG